MSERKKTWYLVYDNKTDTTIELHSYKQIADLLGMTADTKMYNHVQYTLTHGTPIGDGRYNIARFKTSKKGKEPYPRD